MAVLLTGDATFVPRPWELEVGSVRIAKKFAWPLFLSNNHDYGSLLRRDDGVRGGDRRGVMGRRV